MTFNTAKSILLVEDDEDDVFPMLRALKAAGVQNPLFVVGDGVDAVSYLDGERRFADRSTFPMPSLVLLDWQLPRKSGRDVRAWIRGQSALDLVLVVVLTSSAEETDVLSAYTRKANLYLVKPPSADELLGYSQRFHESMG